MEKYETPRPMILLWMEGMNKGILNSNKTNAYQPDLQHIAEAQTKIEWDQILKGCIAKQWIKYQLEALGDNATKQKNATTWATEVISTIFTQWLNLWKLPNEDCHGRDNKSQKEAERKQTNMELEQLYEYQSKIMQSDERIFQMNLEEQKQKPTYTMRAFIQNYSPIIKKSHQAQLKTG
jgi:hypothetical protein